jgi:hypothetical protein
MATLSNMENSDRPTPDEASAALAGANADRDRLAGDLRLPSHFHLTIGAAIAVQIGTAAVGLAGGVREAALPVLVVGLIGFGLVAGVQLARFRRLNGVWLGGLAGRVVLGTATASSVTYAAALALSVWAASGGRWWLVGLAALAGGAGYAYSGVHWVRRYRRDPVAHGRGEPAWQLAALGALSLAGLVFLVLGR